MFRLTITMEGNVVGVHDLADGETVIGRSRSCDIKVGAPDISRSHIKMIVSGRTARVENLSKFGTKLDGEPLEGSADIRGGQFINIGELTTIVVEEVTSSNAPKMPVDADLPQDASSLFDGVTVVANDQSPVEPADAADEKDRTDDKPPSEKEEGAWSAEKTGEGLPDTPDSTSANLDRTAAAPSTRAAVTGVADDASATRFDPSAAGQTSAAPSVFETVASMQTGTEAGHTRAMQTRMVSPEEIDLLRGTEQKRVRNKMLVWFAVGVPLLILAILFRPRTLPPETTIEWPVDEEGNYLDATESAPSGGVSEGGYELLIPGTAGRKVTPTDTGLMIQLKIGRDRDVPMRIYLAEESNIRFVKMTRLQALMDWVSTTSKNGEQWNFDKPYKNLGFYGNEQGIPYLLIPYQRHGDGNWFGAACMFRHGQKRVIVRTEIPAEERLRGENMVLKRYVNPSTGFERSHWESDGVIEKTSVDDLLIDARQNLSRIAPATWAEIETILKSALAKALIAGDTKAYQEATDMLVDLRRRQAQWYNSQRFARDNALAEGTVGVGRRITELSKAVFSNMEDQRYYWVRKW